MLIWSKLYHLLFKWSLEWCDNSRNLVIFVIPARHQVWTQPPWTARALMWHHSHAWLKRMTLKTISNQSKKHTLTHKLESFQISISQWKLVPGASVCHLTNSDLVKISSLWSNRAARGPSPVTPSTRRRHLCTRCHLICLIKLPFYHNVCFFFLPQMFAFILMVYF